MFSRDGSLLPSSYADVRYIDDAIAIEGLMIDLPNGAYTVMLCMVDAGYWEYYQNYNSRQVFIEGKMVLNETMSLADFYSNYYKHQSTEDLPGDSSWDRYIAPRYTWNKFAPIDVVDGSINISFACPSTFGCTVSGLLLYPAAMESVAASFMTELSAAMQLRYDQGYMQYIPPHLPHRQRGTIGSGASSERRSRERVGKNVTGSSSSSNTSSSKSASSAASSAPGTLVVFQRPIDEDVNAYDAPHAGEVVGTDGMLDAVRTFSASNSSVSFAFTLKVPFEGWSGGDIASVTVTSLPANLAVSVYGVRYKQKRMTADGSVFLMAPLLLDPISSSAGKSSHIPAGATLKPGIARRLWIRLHSTAKSAPTTLPPLPTPKPLLEPPTPRTAAATTAAITIRFTASSQPNLVLHLPITLSAATLPPPTQWLGYLGMAPLYSETLWDAVVEKQQSELLPSAQLLHTAGMTAATGGISGQCQTRN